MKLKTMEKIGMLKNKSIAVFALPGHPKPNKRLIKFDRLPNLTLAPQLLFMLRVSELHFEDGLKTLFRFLHPLERFAAQGLDPVAAGTYLPHQLLIKATNNADPPNVLAPYLCPIIHAIAEWGGLEAWPNLEELVRPDIAAKKASLFTLPISMKKGILTKPVAQRHRKPRKVILKKPVRRPRKARKVIVKKPVGRPREVQTGSFNKTRAN